MGLTCNIDARGKRTRLVMGIVQLVVAVGIAGAWALPTGSRVGWIVAIILTVTGAFTVFEARAGWCALRAMGVKTRI